MQLTVGVEPHILNLDFTIPETVDQLGTINKIGVMFSGGIDSAILLCMIITELRDTGRLNGTELRVFTALKRDGSTYYAARLVDQISQMYGVTLHHENNLTNSGIDSGIVDPSVYLSIRSAHPDMLLYDAVNQMVDPTVHEFEHKLQIVYKGRPFWLRSPFMNAMKAQQLDIARKLGVESLIPFAHSCTVEPIAHCGACYSCEERAWGFSLLGETPPETIAPDVVDISYGGTWENT
jgi:hypothetical protein